MQELHMSPDDCLKNIIVIIILVLVHIDRNISESWFLLFLFSFSEIVYYCIYNNTDCVQTYQVGVKHGISPTSGNRTE